MTKDEAIEWMERIANWFAKQTGRGKGSISERMELIKKGQTITPFSSYLEYPLGQVDSVCDWLAENHFLDFIEPLRSKYVEARDLAKEIDQLIENDTSQYKMKTQQSLTRLNNCFGRLVNFLRGTAKTLDAGTPKDGKPKKQKRWTPEEIQNANKNYASKYRKYSDADISKTQKQVYDEVAQEIGFTTGKNPGDALRKAIERYDKKEARKRGAIFNRKTDK